MTVRLPKYSNEYSLLVLLICLCKSFKERLSFPLNAPKKAKAGAKVCFSGEPSKLSQRNFSDLTNV